MIKEKEVWFQLLLWILDSYACIQGLREMVEILESSKNTLEMEVTSVKELKEKVGNLDDYVT